MSGGTRATPLRGRTAPGRLAGLDAWLLAEEGALLASPDPAVVVDVGLGDQPWTTLELRDALAPVHPHLRLIAVDVAPSRVAVARAAGLDAVVGDLDLPLPEGATARLVRVLNVLRERPPDAVAAAHARLGARVRPGGLVIEGNAARGGEALVAHLLRRTPEGLVREGLLFTTNGARGFSPVMFLHQLPRDLRRRARGTAIEALLLRWQALADQAGGGDAAARFARSAEALAEEGAPVRWRPGALCWRPPGGVPVVAPPSGGV